MIEINTMIGINNLLLFLVYLCVCLFKGEFSSADGDSGAPVYLDALLKGVYGGSLKSGGKIVGSYYSRVDEIYSSTGFQPILAKVN